MICNRNEVILFESIFVKFCEGNKRDYSPECQIPRPTIVYNYFFKMLILHFLKLLHHLEFKKFFPEMVQPGPIEVNDNKSNWQFTRWDGGQKHSREVSKCINKVFRHCMMTLSHGNIFRVTGLLCGEFTGHRWFLRAKASDTEFWCFLWSASEATVEQTIGHTADSRCHCAHYDVIVVACQGGAMVTIIKIRIHRQSMVI